MIKNNNNFFIKFIFYFMILVIIILSTLTLISRLYLKNSKYDFYVNRSIKNIKRGNIYDRNGIVLSYSELVDDEYKRFYNFPKLYSLINGYQKKFATSSIEKYYNSHLQGFDNIHSETTNIISKNKSGDHIVLTIDHNLQKRVNQIFQKYNGTIIISDKDNGEVLTLISNPSFDENLIDERNNVSFINRATQGMYIPGSTMKILDSIFILENNLNSEYMDKGYLEVDGHKIRNANSISYGNIDIEDAYVFSINSYFINILLKYDKNFMDFMQKIDLSFKNKYLKVKNIENIELSSDLEKALYFIGQGNAYIQPLFLHTLMSGIANKGVIYEPHLVLGFKDSTNSPIKFYKYEKKELNFKQSTYDKILDLGYGVISSGTLKGVKNKNISGKTGTAELENSKYNYLFTGVIDNKYILTIVIENEGDNNPLINIINNIDYIIKNF